MPDVPIAAIHAPDNVRDLDAQHVDRLTNSIQVVGVLVPLVVQAANDKGDGTYELVAGFHRLAAATQAGLERVPIIVRGENGSTGATPSVDRAVENIVRKDLTPAEEAVALDRALQSGLSESGAAQALGWSAKRVTERKRILELPDDARALVGPALRTDTVDLLIELHTKAPKVWDRLMDSVSVDADNAASLAELQTWVWERAWRDSAKLEAWTSTGNHTEAAMPKMKAKLQDRWRGLVNKEYGYERPFSFSFTDTDLDAAQAAGCFVELGAKGGIVVDKTMALVAAEAAVIRAEQALAAERESKKKTKETVAFEATVKDPQKVLQALERRDVKDTTPAARQANEDLALAMIAGLSKVELTKDVAVFFSRAALGHLWDGGTIYNNARGELTQKIARRVALCVPELRKTVDQGESKAGVKKPVKVEYAEDNEAATWLRRWIEQPKEPGEILGRTLVVFAIATEVDTDVVTKAVEVRLRWFDSDLPTDAIKALGRLVKPHLPGSVKGIRREKAKRERARTDAYKQALNAQHPGEVAGVDEPEQDDGEAVEA